MTMMPLKCVDCPHFTLPLNGKGMCNLRGLIINQAHPMCKLRQEEFLCELDDLPGVNEDEPDLPCKGCGRLCNWDELDRNFIDYCKDCAKELY